MTVGLKLCVLFSQWAAGPDPAAGLPALRGLRHLLQLLLLGLHCEDHHGVCWRRRSSCWMPGEHRLRVSEVSPQLPLLSASHPLPFPHLLFHTYSHPYIETQLSSLVSGWELFCAGWPMDHTLSIKSLHPPLSAATFNFCFSICLTNKSWALLVSNGIGVRRTRNTSPKGERPLGDQSTVS